MGNRFLMLFRAALLIASTAILTDAPTIGSQKELQKNGTGWEISTKNDPMTDSVSASALKRGDAGLISIDCKHGDRGSITVLVGSDKALGSSRIALRKLMYRFDSEPAVERTWTYSGQAAMLTNSEQSVDLLVPMMKAKRLLIRMYAYDGTSYDLSFDATGTAEAVRDIMSKCGIV